MSEAFREHLLGVEHTRIFKRMHIICLNRSYMNLHTYYLSKIYLLYTYYLLEVHIYYIYDLYLYGLLGAPLGGDHCGRAHGHEVLRELRGGQEVAAAEVHGSRLWHTSSGGPLVEAAAESRRLWKRRSV